MPPSTSFPTAGGERRPLFTTIHTPA